ncbi:efflux RND transporter periplasmic adaptor subunit [Asticcacaulis excentricus]|uniref:Efflux transporter, RND family, MFP subunit n=1 Tax=Asticcacaulis excentricus (strain ATCC 15261 / DSM 4724 / KCTC 12464 / NCIMB 9791 / VKM B-1370 / CB 48) TaxID=573065 RepID=E8RUA9_ASTEC|nr:efflux RND transporter periplasmic adaptor subunit [Asticcacaulis excentricus]ADU15080.1 efflux transporter, RND family, MFP subunit [Asticcacaulis excentricus CB 48]
MRAFASAPYVSTAFKRSASRLLLSGVLALSVAACSGQKGEAEKKPAEGALVEATLATEAVAPLVISGSGTVAAWQEAPIGAEVGGLTATAVLADEGQYVQQGQPLLKMNDAVLRAQLQQAQAGIQSARAQAVEAERAYQRYKELFDKGYASQSALDQKEAAYKTAQAQVATAEASAAQAQTQLNQTVVRAPVSGLITSRTAVAGQIVSPGTELFRIVRDNRIEMNMEVVETELSAVKAGMAATVTGETGQTVTGTVRVVTPAVNQQTRLGYARISIPADAGFKPGQFARASITVGEQPAVLVPQKAVVYQQNQPVAFVVGANNKVSGRRLKTGERRGDAIVIASGVSAGEKVVTSGAGFLVDGDAVRVSKTTTPAGAEKAGGQ